MPQFVLDTGSPETASAFNKLDAFTQGYITTLFFTDCDDVKVREGIDSRDTWNPETDSSLPGDVTIADLAPETLARIIADCTAFQATNRALLDEAMELVPGSEDYLYGRAPLDDERLGNLFWYTRNGHGVSFTDDGDAACLEALDKACGWKTAFPNVDSYLGDDGLIYLM